MHVPSATLQALLHFCTAAGSLGTLLHDTLCGAALSTSTITTQLLFLQRKLTPTDVALRTSRMRNVEQLPKVWCHVFRNATTLPALSWLVAMKLT